MNSIKFSNLMQIALCSTASKNTCNDTTDTRKQSVIPANSNTCDKKKINKEKSSFTEKKDMFTKLALFLNVNLIVLKTDAVVLISFQILFRYWIVPVGTAGSYPTSSLDSSKTKTNQLRLKYFPVIVELTQKSQLGLNS